jgi:hypothetical protein
LPEYRDDGPANERGTGAAWRLCLPERVLRLSAPEGVDRGVDSGYQENHNQ